jgi:hypothetical protein
MLDELKSQFNAFLTSQKPEKELSDLEGILHQRKSTIIEKILKNLQKEIHGGIIMSILMGFFMLLIPSQSLKLAGLCGILVGGILMLIIWKKYKQISMMLHESPSNVKIGLQHLLLILTKFTRFYIRYYMVSFVMSFIFGLNLGYFFAMYDVKDPYLIFLKNFDPAQTIAVAMTFVVIIFVGFYYFIKWHLYQKYGKYVEELKQCLAELN